MSAAEGLRAQWQPVRERASALWRARSARDRTALIVVALVLGAFFLWVLFIAPALATPFATARVERSRSIELLADGKGTDLIDWTSK